MVTCHLTGAFTTVMAEIWNYSTIIFERFNVQSGDKCKALGDFTLLVHKSPLN